MVGRRQTLLGSVDGIRELIDDRASREDALDRNKLVLKAAEGRASRAAASLANRQGIAQQWFALDFLLIGIMAAAALGIGQINSQIEAVHNGVLPHGDAILANAGLVGLAIVSFGSLVSAVIVAFAFMGGQGTELGPNPLEIGQQIQGLEASEAPIIIAMSLLAEGEDSLERFRWAARQLRLAVVALCLGFLAGGVTFGLMAG
jgi:hypothetical protein